MTRPDTPSLLLRILRDADGGPVLWKDAKQRIRDLGYRPPGHQRFVAVVRAMETDGVLAPARWIGGGEGGWAARSPTPKSDDRAEPEEP